MAKKYVSLLELLYDTVESMKAREDYGLRGVRVDRAQKNMPLFFIRDEEERGCMQVRLNTILFNRIPSEQEFECPYVLESYFWQPYSAEGESRLEMSELDLSLEEKDVLNQMAILQVLNWYMLTCDQGKALLPTPRHMLDMLVQKGRVHELVPGRDAGQMLGIVRQAYEKFEPFAVSSKKMVKAHEREWFMAPVSTTDAFHIMKENYERTWQAREIGDSRFQMALPLFVAFHHMECETKEMKQMGVGELKKYKDVIPARMLTHYARPITPMYSYGCRGDLWIPEMGRSDPYLNHKVVGWALKRMEERVRSRNMSQLSVEQIDQIQSYQCKRVAIHLNKGCLQWDDPSETKDGDV